MTNMLLKFLSCLVQNDLFRNFYSTRITIRLKHQWLFDKYLNSLCRKIDPDSNNIEIKLLKHKIFESLCIYSNVGAEG